MTVAIYPGSFDPITLGHLDVIERSSKIFDEVVVAIGINSSKNPLFTVEEKKELIEKSVTHLENVSVVSFEGLLVNFINHYEKKVIVKGLRAVSDFEYELQMASVNKDLNKEAETFFLPTSVEYSFLSSSIVRAVAKEGGDVSSYVTPVVKTALKEKFGK